MKFARFGGGRYGLVRDGQVYDITALVEPLLPGPGEVTGDGFVARLAAVRAAVAGAELGAPAADVATAAFLSPVAAPTKIVNAPVNYEAHIAEAAADPKISYNRAVLRIETAGLFLKATSALVGPSQGVAVRFPDRRTDHELELGVVIGTTAADVPAERALEYVAGYAIALDMTVRGTEDRSFRKSIDSYAVLGPWLVSADEISEPNALDMRLRVNGEVRQDSNTRRMIVDVRTLIAWASRWYTLHPGDILMTGTPEGVGPVGDGDVMHCSIERVGEMTVPVRAAAPTALGSYARGVKPE